MCLHPEWFERRGERNAERDRLGVSVRDAEATLQMYHSTVYPVAVEMAEWILRNWSVKKVERLTKPTRDLLHIIAHEEGLSDRNSAQPDTQDTA